MFVKYKKLEQLIAAIQNGDIPSGVVSPGGAAAALGVTRQAVNDRIHKSGTLNAWGAEGYVLVEIKSLKAAYKKKMGIPESQREISGLESPQ